MLYAKQQLASQAIKNDIENLNFKPSGFIPSSYKVYLPQKLDVQKHINKNPLPNNLTCKKSPHYVVDNVKYVLGSLYEVFSNDKDYSLIKNAGFIPLSSHKLQRTVADYNKILEWAVKTGILDTDGLWIEGEKCTGYKFKNKWGKKFQVHYLYKPEIVKRNSLGICKETIKKYPELWGFYQDLEIDMDRVPEILDAIYDKTLKETIEEVNKYNYKYKHLSEVEIQNYVYQVVNEKQKSRYITAEKLADKKWYFKQDDNVGRLHTNLTGLKKEMRQVVSYRGQQLVGVDIKNSQPYLSTTLLDENCWNKLNMTKRILNYSNTLRKSPKHKSVFKHIPITLQDLRGGKINQDASNYRKAALNGRMYELMQEKYQQLTGNTISRDEIKEIFLKILFTPTKLNAKNKVYMDLRKEFPTVVPIFEWVNTGYEKFKGGFNGKYKRKKGEQSATLALYLQQLEAELILDTAIPAIFSNEDIPLFTIHDSIVTTLGNEMIVVEYLKLASDDLFGYTPKLEIEYDKWGIDKTNVVV